MKNILFFIICAFAIVFKMEATIIAVHEHELKPFTDVQSYEKEVAEALNKMQVPGLLHAYHLKGFKGERKGRYTVLWVFKSEQSIEMNFGTESNPKWPADWLFYENEVLAKYLTCLPDEINFTDYTIITKATLSDAKNN